MTAPTTVPPVDPGSSALKCAVAYGARAAARRHRLLVLPAVTVATGAFLLVVVMASMPAVREQGAALGDADAVGRAVMVVSMVVLLVGAFEVAIAATRSVSQRAREIGVLCSFGVAPRSILVALMIEPVATASVGAVVGAAAGAVAAPVAAASGLLDTTPSAGAVATGVALAIGVSSLAACVASAAPCVRAVRRPPLASLTS
jgi:ABC-type lipoprotein release transport system permease subunit